MEVHRDAEEDVLGTELKNRRHWKGVEVGDAKKTIPSVEREMDLSTRKSRSV